MKILTKLCCLLILIIPDVISCRSLVRIEREGENLGFDISNFLTEIAKPFRDVVRTTMNQRTIVKQPSFQRIASNKIYNILN